MRNARKALKTSRELTGTAKASNTSLCHNVGTTSTNVGDTGQVNKPIPKENEKKSASAKKLETLQPSMMEDAPFSHDEGFRITEIGILKSIIEDALCPECKAASLTLF